jgi:hypothetical protein
MKPSPDLSKAQWFKSTYTTVNECVEVAFVEGVVAVRDSKDPTGPALIFTEGEWNAFTKGSKEGQFDLA